MRLDIDGTQYEIPDALVQANVQTLFDRVLSIYNDLSLPTKVVISNMTKVGVDKFAPHVTIHQERGQDYIEALLHTVAELSPEGFKNAIISVNIKGDSISDININIQPMAENKL